MGLLDMIQQDPEKREALRQGLLAAGATMLAGGRQDVGTSLGQGLGAGVSQYGNQISIARQEAEKQRQRQAMQAATEAAMIPARPAVQARPAMAAQSIYQPAPSNEPLMPEMTGQENPLMTYMDYSPEMVQEQTAATPEVQAQAEQPGGFDAERYYTAVLSNPDNPERDAALKYFASKKPADAEKPQLVTVYENGQPVQKWLRPGEAEGVSVGAGKPEAESYKERTISPDGQTYIKQSSTDGGKTWKQIEGTKPYDIRASSGSSNVTVNGFPKETFKNERDLRNDFQGLPTTKAFREVQTSYDQIRYALNNPSAANDLTAATKFMKLLDPGSVVRESELGMAMAATGQFDRMSNYYNMLKTGQKLTPSQRIDFYNSANGLYKAATDRYNQSATEYRTLAQDYELNPDRIAKPAAVENAAKPAGKAKSAGTFKDPIRVTNDADYNNVPKGKYYKAPDGTTRIRK